MLDDFRVTLPIDVRWGDMDAFGHVNNACYFTFCESARMAWLERVGAMRDEATGHGPALAHAECSFRRQVHYPASLQVGARATKVGGKSFTLSYRIIDRANGETVADGTSVVVWVDYTSGSAIPVPDDLRARIGELDPEIA